MVDSVVKVVIVLEVQGRLSKMNRLAAKFRNGDIDLKQLYTDISVQTEYLNGFLEGEVIKHAGRPA